MIDEMRRPSGGSIPSRVAGIILAVVILFALVPRPWNYLLSVVAALGGGIYVWNRMKVEKKHKKTPPELILEEHHAGGGAGLQGEASLGAAASGGGEEGEADPV